MKIEKPIRKTQMDETKFLSIHERQTKTGATWYSISADNGKFYALSERNFKQAEQLLSDIEPDTPLSVWYYENGAFNNITGINAAFNDELPF